MKKNIPFIISLIFVIVIPVFGIAVSFENPISNIKTITDLISELINFLFNIAIFVCAIIIVYSGLLYITAAGNQQKIQTAHKSLTWALIGLAIVLIANFVPGIIKSVLYGSEESSSEEQPSIEEEYTPSEPGLPPSEPGLPPEEEAASGTYKACVLNTATGEAFCQEKIWTGINPGNQCENKSECQKYVYKQCRESLNIGGSPLCWPLIWDGSLENKPANECENDLDCYPTAGSGTYKVCRPPLTGSWAWITGHADTLYCKEENWEGVNPGDECSVLNEVCPEEAGDF